MQQEKKLSNKFENIRKARKILVDFGKYFQIKRDFLNKYFRRSKKL